MKRISWKDQDASAELEALYNRPACPREIEESVSEIVAKVRAEGDDAIADFLARFDKVTLQPQDFMVKADEYAEAERAVDENARQAIDLAIATV